MIRINLLPYRAQRRQAQILQHIAIFVSVVLVTSALVFSADVFKTSELTDLQDEFSSLKAQNQVLQKKIGKIKNLDNLRADVERKLKLVDELQNGRFYSLVTLNELSKVIPENVWLTSVSNVGDNLQLSGLGESNKAVANFMRALDEEAIFSNIKLQTITRTQAGNVPVRSFSLNMSRIINDSDKGAGK